MFAWLKTGDADRYCTLFNLPVNTEGTIENSRFSWELPGKEFLYNNNLYDVVAIVVKNRHAIIRCVADKAEDRLLQKMQLAFTHQKDGKSRASTALLKFFSAFVSVKNTTQMQLYETLLPHPAILYSCYYPSGVSAINTPPPEIG